MRARAPMLMLLAAGVVVVGVVVGFPMLRDAVTSWSDEPQAPVLEWSGPVHLDGRMDVQHMAVQADLTLSWAERRDAAISRVDITRLGLIPDGQTHWYIELAAWPAQAAVADPVVVAHGLVLETTGDAIADYVVGIANDAPQAADFHVWVSDLATGETKEQIGGPYGFPVEFGHPQEALDSGIPGPPTLLFTFLPGSAPSGATAPSMRFYAWASATRGGDVVAWDYAPDASWLTAPPAQRP
jgi:hypothetical protein